MHSIASEWTHADLWFAYPVLKVSWLQLNDKPTKFGWVCALMLDSDRVHIQGPPCNFFLGIFYVYIRMYNVIVLSLLIYRHHVRLSHPWPAPLAAARAARFAAVWHRVQLCSVLATGLRHERPPGERAQLDHAQPEMAAHVGVLNGERNEERETRNVVQLADLYRVYTSRAAALKLKYTKGNLCIAKKRWKYIANI